jgi:Haem-binding domain
MLVGAGLGLLGAALVLQVLPIGAPRTNPPVEQDANWPNARARELAVGACYACHSNQTRWPAYSYVAPAKWLVTRDVTEGREALNFSTWGEDSGEADDAAETVADHSMPPIQYRLLHAEARLSDADRQLLIDALEQMDTGGGGDEAGGDAEDGGSGRGRGRGRGGG